MKPFSGDNVRHIQRKKRVLVIHPNAGDGTSFYRAHGPFTEPTFHDWDIALPDSSIEWYHIAACDIVFMARPVTADHKRIAEDAKRLGKKLVVDLDDYFFGVPASNPGIGFYPQDRLVEIMAILCLADQIWVSTDYLAHLLTSKHDLPEAIVKTVPNAWNDYLHDWEKPKHKDAKAFLWRGSATHDGDVYAHIEDLREVAKIYEEHKFIFLGNPPSFVFQALDPKRILHSGRKPLPEYYSILQKVSAQVGIVPLADNDFNRAKSNIGWIESTMAGCATVCPDFDGWPGVDYGKEMTLFEATCLAMDSSKACFEESYDLVQQNYLLSKVNKQRKRLLSEL